MRTRRSWKNQNRLFKELFEPDKPIKKPIARVCFNCRDYTGLRSRGKCEYLGAVVSGTSKDCFFFKGRNTDGR